MFLITPREVQGSGHCVICEQGIDGSVQTFVVDTLFDTELPGHYLDGRKYVCQGCVFDIQRVCGFAKGSEVDALKEQLSLFEDDLEEVLRDVRRSVNTLSEVLPSIPQVPNIDYIQPTPLVNNAEPREKPVRGRPKKEPSF